MMLKIGPGGSEYVQQLNKVGNCNRTLSYSRFHVFNPLIEKKIEEKNWYSGPPETNLSNLLEI